MGRWIIAAALAAAVLVGGGYMATRGLRNNNPGNLRYDARIPWRGQIGPDADGYARFATPFYGLRALALDLRNQQRLHGLDTVRSIIQKFAPPEDHNDTAAYIADVSARLGVGPDDRLDLSSDATAAAFVRAVIDHENGAAALVISQADIEQAVASA